MATVTIKSATSSATWFEVCGPGLYAEVEVRDGTVRSSHGIPRAAIDAVSEYRIASWEAAKARYGEFITEARPAALI